MTKMFYSDVAEVAEFINFPIQALWNMAPVFQDPYDRMNEPFTFDMLLLRRMCQHLPTDLTRKALGKGI